MKKPRKRVSRQAMRNRPTWYPGADKLCGGSNQIAITSVDRDSKVQCAVCGRNVGLRNPRTKQIAMHRPPQPVVSVDSETTPLQPFIRKPIPEVLALFVLYCLHPWLNRYEQELSRKLFPSLGRTAGKYFVKFDTRKLMYPDAAARSTK